MFEDRPARARYGEQFLTSPRAVAVCTRELTHLADELVRRLATLDGTTADEKPTVRRSPDRCIVQLGPVALTLAWLRGNSGSVAEGELLVIVWRGAVAPRHHGQPERPSASPPLAATPLWEQVFTAVGDSEDTWGWQPQSDGEIGRCSSAELAARCVARLRAEYLEREVQLPRDRDTVRAT